MVGDTRGPIRLQKLAERPVWVVRRSALTGLFLFLFGLTLLFERLAGLFGGGLTGRLIGHVNPLSLREAYSRRQHRTCSEATMMFLLPDRRGSSHGQAPDRLGGQISQAVRVRSAGQPGPSRSPPTPLSSEAPLFRAPRSRWAMEPGRAALRVRQGLSPPYRQIPG